MPDQLAQAFECFQRGDFATAKKLCQAMVNANPSAAEAWHLYGVVEHQLGNNQVGVEHVRKAIELKPEDPQYHYNLGVLSNELGNTEDTIAAYIETLRLNPNHPAAANNLGNCYRSKGAFGKALETYKIAAKAEPNSSKNHRSVGMAHKMIGDLDAAIEHLEKAVKLDRRDTQTRSDLIFCYQYQEGITAEKLAELHGSWDKAFGRSNAKPAYDVRKDADRQIRLGFLSPDLGHHPVGIFLAPLLEKIDRSRFHITAYSDRGNIDSQTKRIMQSCDRWRHTKGAAEDALRNQIQADEIDILFDLPGHTDDNRLGLFAQRVAPLQMTWGGYVGSTGLRAMDYIVCDRHHVPKEVEPHYSETPLRLAHDYIGYHPPDYAPDVGPPPSEAAGYVTFGSMNNPTKINAGVARVWSRILNEIPGSRLMLKYKGFDDPAVMARIHKIFADYGIGPDRLDLLGNSVHKDHLDHYNKVDVILDPFPYSGGLTTCEALWMGVPTVTWPGDTFASRHSMAHMTNAGFTETVVNSEDEYVFTACEWANDVPLRAELRQTLRDQTAESPLCDLDRHAASFAKEMERAWRMWCVGGKTLFPFHSLSAEIPKLKAVEITTGSGDGALPLAIWRGTESVDLLTVDPDEKPSRSAELGLVQINETIGDGGEVTCHRYQSPALNSLLSPDSELRSRFQGLEESADEVERDTVKTKRLDDLEQVKGADFLLIDTNGSELDVLKGAENVLAQALVVQVRSYFISLFEGQPLFAEIDTKMHSAGFGLHRLRPINGRAVKPFIVNKNLRRGYSQDLWADAVYIRDHNALADLPKQDLLKTAAILHDLYGSYDLAAEVLGNIGEQFQKAYYKELGLG